MKKYLWISLAVWGLIVAAYLLVYLKTQKSVDPNEKPFVIVTTFHNTKDYFKKNLDSIVSQKYSNFIVIYVNDASTDDTPLSVSKYIHEKGLEDKVFQVHNKIRMGALANLDKTVRHLKSNEIVVVVDPDDWLAHDNVLAYLNQVYEDPNVWLTYGQFSISPTDAPGFASQIPQDVIEQNTFRSSGGATHLKTFYAGLYQHISHDDLLFQGQYYPLAWDNAILMPMLEMSGIHSRFIPDVLYVYNKMSALKEENLNRELQIVFDQRIRAKKKYKPIDSYE